MIIRNLICNRACAKRDGKVTRKILYSRARNGMFIRRNVCLQTLTDVVTPNYSYCTRVTRLPVFTLYRYYVSISQRKLTTMINAFLSKWKNEQCHLRGIEFTSPYKISIWNVFECYTIPRLAEKETGFHSSIDKINAREIRLYFDKIPPFHRRHLRWRKSPGHCAPQILFSQESASTISTYLSTYRDNKRQ